MGYFWATISYKGKDKEFDSEETILIRQHPVEFALEENTKIKNSRMELRKSAALIAYGTLTEKQYNKFSRYYNE